MKTNLKVNRTAILLFLTLLTFSFAVIDQQFYFLFPIYYRWFGVGLLVGLMFQFLKKKLGKTT